jgi:hypothetical protein
MKGLVITAAFIAVSLVAPARSVAAQDTSEIMTAVDGDATVRGLDRAPSHVTVTGETEPSAPAAAPAGDAPPSVAGCDSYTSWYDAQVAYESAGGTSAAPELVNSLDPDYDGIACEDAM